MMLSKRVRARGGGHHYHHHHSKLLRSRARCTCAHNARHYGTSLWGRCAHYPVAQRCGECGEATAYRYANVWRGTWVQFVTPAPRVYLGENRNYNQVSPRPLHFTRRRVSRILSRFCRAEPGPLSRPNCVQLRISTQGSNRPAAESRCNRCLRNHPLRDTSGSLGIPWNARKTH